MNKCDNLGWVVNGFLVDFQVISVQLLYVHDRISETIVTRSQCVSLHRWVKQTESLMLGKKPQQTKLIKLLV